MQRRKWFANSHSRAKSFLICCILFYGVFLSMIRSVGRHRSRKERANVYDASETECILMHRIVCVNASPFVLSAYTQWKGTRSSVRIELKCRGKSGGSSERVSYFLGSQRAATNKTREQIKKRNMPNTDIAHERARSSQRTCCIRCSKMIAHAKCCRRRYFSSSLLFFFLFRLLHLCFFMLLLLFFLSLPSCVCCYCCSYCLTPELQILYREGSSERLEWSTRKTSFIDYRWPLLQRKTHTPRALSLTLLHAVFGSSSGLNTETVQNAMPNRRSYELCVRMKTVGCCCLLCARYARAHEPYA